MDPLQQFRGLERASPYFYEHLKNILRGKEYQNILPKLQSEDLAWLVEYLDNTVAGVSDGARIPFQESLNELRKICGRKGVLPKSCTLSGSLLECVYEGTFDGSKVRIRRVRTRPGADPRSVMEVAVLAKHIAHPNVVPLLGVIVDLLELISDWMPGGDLTTYIINHSDANRHSLLSDVAEGLRYLHSCNVIHGDLKASNILVDATGHARITDFGLAMVTQDLSSIRSASAEGSQNARWIAPEILDEGGSYSKEADIFSFAGVTIEIFTGAAPFGEKPPCEAILAVTSGERPPRPPHPTLTDGLWELVQQCWHHEPRMRPHALQISRNFVGVPAWKRLVDCLASQERISLITDIFSDRHETEVAKRLCGEDAQSFVEVVYEMLDALAPRLQNKCLGVLREICDRQALLPRSVKIPLCCNLSDTPLDQGGYTEAWKGQHQGCHVLVKVLRPKIYSTSDFEMVTSRFCKEVVTWKSLCHPNVLPLFGVTIVNKFFAVASEWMDNGNINEFIRANQSANRFELLREVTGGLIYLHDQEVPHGDLKGANVLIDKNGHARLADSGLLAFVSDPANLVVSSSTTNAGAARWMSPELLNPGLFDLDDSQPTKESDLYSLGMVVLEVLSGQVPFALHEDSIIVQKVIEGEHPEMPEEAWLTNDLRRTLEHCWLYQPRGRPTVEVVLGCLEQVSIPHKSSSPSSKGESVSAEKCNLQSDDHSSRLLQSHPLSATNSEVTCDDRGPSTTQQPLPSSIGRTVSVNTNDERSPLSATGLDSIRDAAPPRPAATTPRKVSASVYLRKIVNWDGTSQDIDKVLTAAFAAKDYSRCVGDLRAAKISPISYVNALDKAAGALPVNSDLLKSCIGALAGTCSFYGILPTSHEITFPLTEPCGQPVSACDYFNHWRLTGKDNHGQVFAAKSFFAFAKIDMKKKLCGDAVVLKRMNHPNFLSIEGVAPQISDLCILSKWMVNGNVPQYLARHPRVDRLELIIGVTRGLGYLHCNGIIHGELRSQKILIDADGNPRLYDFRFCSFSGEPQKALSTDHHRYYAPEYIRGRLLATGTKNSDVYSLSMFIVELVTREIPFPDLDDYSVSPVVCRGVRPPKPESFDDLGISPAVWEIAERCWHQEANQRPRIKAVLRVLEEIANLSK